MKYLVMAAIGSIMIGYFIGIINLSYLLSKFKGFDIRKYGSGNAGASNVVIIFGKKAGIIVALIDILKAVIAVSIAKSLFPNAVVSDINWAGLVAGASTIIGHIAPFYMGFKGGKGLASLGGTILASDYRLFIILLIIAVVIAVVTDYICFVPITMVVAFPATYSVQHGTWVPMIVFIVPILMVWYRHIENLQRIRIGKELKFHFLWNRNSESERFGIEDNGEDVFAHELDESRVIKN